MHINGDNVGHTKPWEDEEFRKNWKDIDWTDKDSKYEEIRKKTKFGYRVTYKKILKP
jgi:hypothetical protein